MATLITPKGKPRALPTTVMKAAAIDKFGPPEVIRLHEVPIPEIAPHEVLIALHAAGVGVWDIEIRTGAWRPKGRPKFPLILGLDGAGVIAAKGSQVRRFAVGDRVWSYDWANRKGGFYAEYAAVDHMLLGPVPEHLSLLEAGAASVTALTALQGIDDHLKLRKGETILIFGATGAVGTMAVQFADLRLARVIATASDHRGAVTVRKLGADATIDARRAFGPPNSLKAMIDAAHSRGLMVFLEKNSGIGRFGGEWIMEEFTRPHWITVQHGRRDYPF